MHPEHSNPEQTLSSPMALAALHTAARAEAVRLRAEAMNKFWTAVGRRLRAVWTAVSCPVRAGWRAMTTVVGRALRRATGGGFIPRHPLAQAAPCPR